MIPDNTLFGLTVRVSMTGAGSGSRTTFAEQSLVTDQQLKEPRLESKTPS